MSLEKKLSESKQEIEDIKEIAKLVEKGLIFIERDSSGTLRLYPND